MAKDPAFLFYSKDWIEGTAEMLPEEKGVYMDLLAHQHQKGSLPVEFKRLCKLASLGLNEFQEIWNGIAHKFCKIEIEGEMRFVNAKLSEVMGDRKTKGHKNTIIGTFASLIRTADLSKATYKEVKSRFNVDDFMNFPREEITERLTEWFNDCLIAVKEGKPQPTVKQINIPFEKFWDLYDKKAGDKQKAKDKWEALKDEERDLIIKTLPGFKESISDKKYQPLPTSYLNQKRWNDEITNTPLTVQRLNLKNRKRHG